MKSWFLYSISALFLWGLWSFFPKLASKYLNPKSILFFEISGAASFSIYILLNSGLSFHIKGFIFSFLTGIFGACGALFFLKALSEGPVSLVTIITSLYPVITVILAYIFLGESLSLRQILGIILAISGIILVLK